MEAKKIKELPCNCGCKELHIIMRPGSTDVMSSWDITPQESEIITKIKASYENHIANEERKQWSDFKLQQESIRDQELADYREKLTMSRREQITMRPARRKKTDDSPCKLDIILGAAMVILAVIMWVTL